MAEKLTAVYAASTLQEAYQLKNVLSEVGIEAVVTNEALATGAGVDIVGLPTSPRVIVAERDVPMARRIAQDFDRMISSRADFPSDDAIEPEDVAHRLDVWPKCPKCDALRTTQCPVCHTAGTDFPEADRNFLGTADLADDAQPLSCGCGSGGCSAGGAGADDAEAAPGAVGQQEPDEPGVMLMCTTCDEPFEPEYLRRCEWCGHEFDDGREVQQAVTEMLGPRAIAVMLGLAVLLIAAAVYFITVM